MEARFDPTKVFRRRPVCARHSIPCAMQQVRRLDSRQQGRHLRRIQQVCLMPADAVRDVLNRRSLARRDGMDFIAVSDERGQAMPADEAACAGEQNFLHASKFEYCLSRSPLASSPSAHSGRPRRNAPGGFLCVKIDRLKLRRPPPVPPSPPPARRRAPAEPE
jgi:hypothetical protein